jgi:hypothetical protein
MIEYHDITVTILRIAYIRQFSNRTYAGEIRFLYLFSRSTVEARGGARPWCGDSQFPREQGFFSRRSKPETDEFDQ